MNKIKPILKGCMLGALLTASQVATSALVTIDGSLFGSDFDVTYDDQALGLFGTPLLSNNTVFFLPTEFKAQSVGGSLPGLTSSTVNLTITPHENISFESFNLDERGDYFLQNTTSSVSVTGQMRVRSLSDPLSESNMFVQSSDTSNEGIANWEALASVMEGSGDLFFPVTDTVIVTIQDILVAVTQDLTGIAFIEKKFVGLHIDAYENMNPGGTHIPIPNAALFFMSALGLGFGLVAKKRRTAP